MTIQEAIKSGKPFKRASWLDKWSEDSEYIEDVNEFEENIHDIILNADDILSDDWEVRHE